MIVRRLLCVCLLRGMALGAEPAVPPEMKLAPLPRRVPVPKENPATPEKIALGRALFFDPVLSATKTTSCATCHQPDKGWADGRETALGTASLERNTLTILNSAFNTGGMMFWDNREHTLEAQVLHPLRTREEMRGDACGEREVFDLIVQRVRGIADYQKRFHAVFDGEPTMPRIAQAIAAFERTLVTPDTPFDKFMRGDKAALSASQQNGMKIFQQAGCIQCHGGPMLSDFKLHVIAAPGERQAFRTPSLRNLKHTAPFMHNGTLRTLDDVLVFYEQLMDEVSETLDGGDKSAQPPLDPLLQHLSLKPEDFADLKAFLLSLSADKYDQQAPAKKSRHE